MHPKSITEETTNEDAQIGSRRRFFPEFGYNSRMLDGGDAQIGSRRSFFPEFGYNSRMLDAGDAHIGLRRRFFPEFGYNSRMLDGGDADSDVIRNFKQTIIHQEQIFCHQLHELHDLYQKHKNLGKMPCSNANVANTDGAANPNLLQTSPIEKNRESSFSWQSRLLGSSPLPKQPKPSRKLYSFDLNKSFDLNSDEMASEITSHEQNTNKDPVSILPAKIPYAVENKSSVTQSSPRSSNKAPQFEFDLNMVYSEESTSAILNDTQTAGSSANSNGVTNDLGVPIFSQNCTQEYNCHSMIRKSDPPCTTTETKVDIKQTEGERSEEDTLSSRTKGNSTDMYNNISYTTGRQDVQEQPFFLASENYRNNQRDPLVTNPTITQPVLHEPDIFVIQEQAEQIQSENVSDREISILEAACIINSFLLRESSVKSQYSQVCCPQVIPIESDDDKIIEKSQSLSDSFELEVLTLRECHEGESSSPTWWKIEKETVKDDTRRFKTRSGRRLHDFQKDILPGMVSLSRQEICEDLHSFAEIRKADEFSKKVGKGSRAKRSRHK